MESQPRVDRLTFKGQDRMNAFMHAAQGFLGDKPVQPFHAEGEFAQRQSPFSRQPTVAQPFKVLFSRIIRAVNNAKIFTPPHLKSRLHQFALGIVHDES